MSKRNLGSANESLAEALSRVMVTRDEADHRENTEWATQEGRGDRMPRFLERAIQDVPHAAHMPRRQGSQARYVGRSRSFARRATFVMSAAAVAIGVTVSLAGPSGLAPLAEQATQFWNTASLNMSFASRANAATPRLAFGEALRNYSEQAAAQAARGNILVTDLVPGTTLSAGAPVSETAWSLPQSELDNLVITFPNGAPTAAMRATVEIPGNTAASSGRFSVELRQAEEAPSTEVEPDVSAHDPSPAPDAEVVAEQPAPPPARKATPAKADDDVVKASKRKPKPSADLKAKSPLGAASVAKSAARQVVSPSLVATTTSSTVSGSSAPSLFGLFPFNSPSPNALTMFSLGGPMAE